MNREFCIARPERYAVHGLDGIETPRLLLFDWALRANRQKLKAASDGFRQLRLMAKTCKASALLEEYHGDGLDMVKASGVREARVIAQSTGIADILVAFPLYGPAIEVFRRLQREFPDKRFSVVVPNRACARELSDGADTEVDVFLDVDPGMKRMGVAFGQPAVELAGEIAALPRLQLVGLHLYDGQIHMANAEALALYSDRLMDAIDGTIRALGDGHAIREVVTSSSLTAESNLAAHRAGGYPWGHTVSPGTAVLWDSGYNDAMPGAFEYAAAVATRIVDVREHRGTHVLTTDCGHKMGASTDQGPVHVLNVRGYEAFGTSELFGRLVWLGFDRETGEPLEGDPQAMLGRVVLVFPQHVCPTVNQYSFALRVRDGAVAEQVAIDARDGG